MKKKTIQNANYLQTKNSIFMPIKNNKIHILLNKNSSLMWPSFDSDHSKLP